MSRAFRIVTLPGDGIGKEVTAEAMEILRAIERLLPGFRFEIEEHPAGAQCYLEQGTDLPAGTRAACESADAIFLGAMGLPAVRRADGTEVAPQLDLRRDLDLDAGVRPVHLFHEAHTPLKGFRAGEIDLVLVRESTEGLFASRDCGVRVGNQVAIDNLVITRGAARRVFEKACEIAQGRRGRLTCVDKANVFVSYAFFREVFDEVVKDRQGLEADHLYVDAAALQLVREPRRFDVLVTENMFGDILSDLLAGLVGGMGMAPSADLGRDHAVFQPAHGSAPDIAGRGIANPVAAILSVEMMLDHLAQTRAEPRLHEGARAIRRAVESLFDATPRTTPDLGGSMTTREVGAALCGKITPAR